MSKTKKEGLDFGGEVVKADERLFQNPVFEQLMQAKSMTFASYCLTPLQMNMLIHIQEELQTVLIKSLDKLPKKRIITVPLYLKDFPHYKRDIKRFFGAVTELMEKNNVIRFQWRYSKNYPEIYKYFMLMDDEIKTDIHFAEGQLISCAAAVITAVYFIEGRNDALLVSLNPATLPFLIYYGLGVGSTVYNKEIALGFVSYYSKRIYQFISDWSTCCSIKDYDIKEFRKHLRVPESYTNRELCTRVLDVAKREINESNSLLSFDYALVYDPQYGIDTKRRKTANKIVFTIFKQQVSPDNERKNAIDRLNLLLDYIASSEKKCLCRSVAERAVDAKQDLKLSYKFTYYLGRLQNGKITESHCRATLLKIVRDMTGVDLRSQAHILHYELNRRKRSPVKISEPKLIANVNS